MTSLLAKAITDPSFWLGLATLLISTGVAYHIAHRQGAFSASRARLLYGRVPAKGERPRQPWMIAVALPEASVETYAIEMPLSLMAGRRPLADVWIQVAYPKGRHGAEALKARLQAPEDGHRLRRYDVGQYTNMEATFPSTKAHDRMVFTDLVSWNSSDFTEANYEPVPGTKEDLESFRWVADKVTVTLRSQNHAEISFTFWLAAIIVENEDQLGRRLGLVAELLMRRDGITISRATPGRAVAFKPWQRRHGLLVRPKFPVRTRDAMVDRLADDSRSAQEVEFLPIGNTLAPRLALDR